MSLVKKRTADMTLAIGDGISSVNLFQIIISREQNTWAKKMKKKEKTLIKNRLFFT